MANYQNLDIYHAAYQLMKVYTEYNRHLQRDLRYTVGEKAYEDLMQVILCIYRINEQSMDKQASFLEAHEAMVRFSVTCRLLCELHQISDGQHGVLIEMIANVDNQLSNWQHYFEKHPVSSASMKK